MLLFVNVVLSLNCDEWLDIDVMCGVVCYALKLMVITQYCDTFNWINIQTSWRQVGDNDESQSINWTWHIQTPHSTVYTTMLICIHCLFVLFVGWCFVVVGGIIIIIQRKVTQRAFSITSGVLILSYLFRRNWNSNE